MYRKEAKVDVYITFTDRESYDREEERISELILKHPGPCRVVIYLEKERASKKIMRAIDNEAVKILEAVFGKERVKVIETGEWVWRDPRPADESLHIIADALDCIVELLKNQEVDPLQLSRSQKWQEGLY